MRDDHEGLPELINTFEKEGFYFCILELKKTGVRQQFQFGVSNQGYVSLKNVFQHRPFSNMPGLKHRYFFVPAYGYIDDQYLSMTIRVEQEKQAKQFTFKAPKNLVANLSWFFQLQNWDEAKHLIIDT